MRKIVARSFRGERSGSDRQTNRRKEKHMSIAGLAAYQKFMDAKDAEARANAPKVKNPYLEMANYILNQRKKEA